MTVITRLMMVANGDAMRCHWPIGQLSTQVACSASSHRCCTSCYISAIAHCSPCVTQAVLYILLHCGHCTCYSVDLLSTLTETFVSHRHSSFPHSPSQRSVPSVTLIIVAQAIALLYYCSSCTDATDIHRT